MRPGGTTRAATTTQSCQNIPPHPKNISSSPAHTPAPVFLSGTHLVTEKTSRKKNSAVSAAGRLSRSCHNRTKLSKHAPTSHTHKQQPGAHPSTHLPGGRIPCCGNKLSGEKKKNSLVSATGRHDQSCHNHTKLSEHDPTSHNHKQPPGAHPGMRIPCGHAPCHFVA